jgi:hypothetical protein
MQARPILGICTPWQPVSRVEELEFLVKESEVLTGHSGRRFVIASADRLYYQVHWRSPALVIDRHGAVCDRQFLLPWEFEQHPLARAMDSRQLFATAIAANPEQGVDHA